MKQYPRYRFWVESVLGSLTGSLALVTLFWQNWIEILFGVDPDRGNGSVERLVVICLLTVTLILAACARLEWRRAAQARL